MKVIPLLPRPNQIFTSNIPVDSQNIALKFKLFYNTEANYWVLTISDVNDNILIDSLPIFADRYPEGNLLEQYKYLRIGSLYVVTVSDTLEDIPNSENLGIEHLLVWGDTNI